MSITSTLINSDTFDHTSDSYELSQLSCEFPNHCLTCCFVSPLALLQSKVCSRRVDLTNMSDTVLETQTVVFLKCNSGI